MTPSAVPHAARRAYYSPPLIFSRSLPDGLNVTTRRASSSRSSPVAGFLPLLGGLSLMANLPNPETSTSSPFSKQDFIISKRDSTISPDLSCVYPLACTCRIISCFVSAISCFLFFCGFLISKNWPRPVTWTTPIAPLAAPNVFHIPAMAALWKEDVNFNPAFSMTSRSDKADFGSSQSLWDLSRPAIPALHMTVSHHTPLFGLWIRWKNHRIYCSIKKLLAFQSNS